jgi:putative intracellular protease/amidase
MIKSILFLTMISVSFLGYAQPKKILIVSTNIDSVGSNVSGTFLMEIAFPFDLFIQNGFEVDIVTPEGGEASVYHSGTMSDELSKIYRSEEFVSKIENSLKPAQVRAGDYAGIYFPGGHGQFWDVVTDERIAAITATIYESGGVVGSAGHGTASLVNVRLSNCNYLVNKKKMTCFPWWTEKEWMIVSDYGKLLPFDMESVLRRRGAELIISKKETMKDVALSRVSEARIVTASFASSAKWVAEEMTRLIRLRN